MPSTVNGIPYADPDDSVSSWPGTSRSLADWLAENAVRRGDIINDAPPAEPHTHSIAEVQGLGGRLAQLETLVAALTPGPWLEFPLTSPAIPGSSAPAYRVHGGYCYVRGRVERSDGAITAGVSWVCGNLPPEARPFHTVRSIIVGGTSSNWGRLEVSPTSGDATIAAISGNVNYLDLTGLMWPVSDDL